MQQENLRSQGSYLVLISVHGLMRGANLELGRDADTGGQTKYVVELARALASSPGVARVDVLTRRVFDPKIPADYSVPCEPIAERANIIRLACGPRRYLRKEALWNYLDCFADNALRHVRSVGMIPDAVHAHYADAGYVGVRLASLLGVPLVFTGHSLGRIKRARLLEKGLRPEAIESRYAISRRIDAEEQTLAAAAMVVASTQQEVDEQYAGYDHYQPQRMSVIPPGTDLERFRPPRRGDPVPTIKPAVDRFLADPRKPPILALSRPDERKNIPTLVRTFAEHPRLRQIANLIIVAGNREDIRSLDKGAREVLTELLMLIDKYDLYGHVAIPKSHRAEDVPDLYRMASRARGVFVNPALTEPFGLTLIEAAASGVPIVATHDGGPQDIVKHCQNGILVDPLDAEAMGEALHTILTEPGRWKRFSENGIRGAQRHFSWSGHARSYLRRLKELTRGYRPQGRGQVKPSRPLTHADRVLFADVDNVLIGDTAALQELLDAIKRHWMSTAFGIATGRRLDSTLEVLHSASIPIPDVLITTVGTEIYYGGDLTPDRGWTQHIEHSWERETLAELMDSLPGLSPQPEEAQSRFKLSYFIDPVKAPAIKAIERMLRRHDLRANVLYSHGGFLDLVPMRASKGFALRYFADKWSIALDHVLVAGVSGSDEDMMRGNTLAVAVAGHDPELAELSAMKKVYFADGANARGVLQGIEFFDFFDACRIPED